MTWLTRSDAYLRVENDSCCTALVLSKRGAHKKYSIAWRGPHEKAICKLFLVLIFQSRKYSCIHTHHQDGDGRARDNGSPKILKNFLIFFFVNFMLLFPHLLNKNKNSSSVLAHHPNIHVTQLGISPWLFRRARDVQEDQQQNY